MVANRCFALLSLTCLQNFAKTLQLAIVQHKLCRSQVEQDQLVLVDSCNFLAISWLVLKTTWPKASHNHSCCQLRFGAGIVCDVPGLGRINAQQDLPTQIFLQVLQSGFGQLGLRHFAGIHGLDRFGHPASLGRGNLRLWGHNLRASLSRGFTELLHNRLELGTKFLGVDRMLAPLIDQVLRDSNRGPRTHCAHVQTRLGGRRSQHIGRGSFGSSLVAWKLELSRQDLLTQLFLAVVKEPFQRSAISCSTNEENWKLQRFHSLQPGEKKVTHIQRRVNHDYCRDSCWQLTIQNGFKQFQSSTATNLLEALTAPDTGRVIRGHGQRSFAQVLAMV